MLFVNAIYITTLIIVAVAAVVSVRAATHIEISIYLLTLLSQYIIVKVLLISYWVNNIYNLYFINSPLDPHTCNAIINDL